MFLVSLFSLFLITLAIYLKKTMTQKNTLTNHSGDLIQIPEVNGAWPIVGHGLSFSKNPLDFIKKCKEKYGNVFIIRVFGKKMIIACDQTFKNEFFKSDESNLSFYNILPTVNFHLVFSEDKDFLQEMIEIIKKNIHINTSEYGQPIFDEAKKYFKNFSDQDSLPKNIDIIKLISRYIANTTAKCFINMELNDELYNSVVELSHVINAVIVNSYVFPEKLISLIYGRKLKHHRGIILKHLEKVVFQNPNYQPSSFMQKCKTYKKKNGDTLTQKELGEIIICLMYVAVENTSLAISATITEMTKHSDSWEKVYKITCEFFDDQLNLEKEKINSFFNQDYFQGVFREAGRLNSHVFAIQRKPMNTVVELAGYTAQNIDLIGLCQPLLMKEGDTPFSNSLEFKPERYLEPMNESKSQSDVITFSSGFHACRGRLFATYEAIAAIAVLAKLFNKPIIKYEGPANNFSPAAICDKEVVMDFILRK